MFYFSYLYQPTHEFSVLECFLCFYSDLTILLDLGGFVISWLKFVLAVGLVSELNVGNMKSNLILKFMIDIHPIMIRLAVSLFCVSSKTKTNHTLYEDFLIKITHIPNSLYWLWVKVFHDTEFANMKFATMSDFCYDNKNIKLPHSCFSNPTLSEMCLLQTEREYSFSI